MSLKSILYSQNFLISSGLVKKLVELAGITSRDVVIEIDPGKGIITHALSKKAKQVIAVEIDPNFIHDLSLQFANTTNVKIIQEDIRTFALPAYTYKVFSNIPFNITADIVYKLLYYSSSPEDTFLIMQKEAAEKFSGSPKETQFSVLAKPWFDFTIIHTFKNADFSPQPGVVSVLLHIKKKEKPLILSEDENLYKSFIIYAFHSWKKDLKTGLKKIFTYAQWRRFAHVNNFSIHAKPTDLSFAQWYQLFLFFKIGVSSEKKKQIR